MSQKLIKELPSLVPNEEAGKGSSPTGRPTRARCESPESAASNASLSRQLQNHGDKTAEVARKLSEDSHNELEQRKEELGRNPGEKAFFKLLHAELKKATHFFDKAQQEFLIREERVREGMEIMKQPNSIMVNEKWSLLAKSIYRLYKDLLLLETFAIMTYCSFSKILKKHDKVTGYDTRAAFMQNVVHKANFTSYPRVMEMISRCERLYEEVSEQLMREGKECLLEDERLFINMISRLNAQVLSTEDGEGAVHPERKETKRSQGKIEFPAAQNETTAITTLRTLVEEHDARADAVQVSEGHVGVDGLKRPAVDSPKGEKRRKTE